ncbi:MAG: class I SAM-dependent methyltransferase [Polyangiaceae bacterium]|nr:class I SAM-dependent methyltransferase [Polyangiaceae bacterium]
MNAASTPAASHPRPRWMLGALAAALLALGAGCVEPQAQPSGAAQHRADVPFVRTHDRIVDLILDMGGVSASDVVYDLGCGDGRIVIAAAAKRGARGVGVDIEPKLIADSRENARRAGVQDRLRFAQQDLFKTDVREATVVTLYLLPEVNLKLRPKLLAELRPGTRVVSHMFDMGDWAPDRRAELGGSTVYLWVIPARVEGAWTLGDDDVLPEAEITLRQRFQEVSGSMRSGGVDLPLEEVTLRGAELRFTLRRAGDLLRFQGRVDGDAMTGRVDGAGGAPRPFKATRRPEADGPGAQRAERRAPVR